MKTFATICAVILTVGAIVLMVEVIWLAFKFIRDL